MMRLQAMIVNRMMEFNKRFLAIEMRSILKIRFTVLFVLVIILRRIVEINSLRKATKLARCEIALLKPNSRRNAVMTTEGKIMINTIIEIITMRDHQKNILNGAKNLRNNH